MNRRNFIKGAIVTTATLASKKAFADDYSQKAISDLNRLRAKMLLPGWNNHMCRVLKPLVLLRQGNGLMLR